MIKYQKISCGACLKRNESQQRTLPLIKDMYTNIMTCVRACEGKSDIFSIKVEFHQGLVLSLYIFT
jgi:hypothetical protein